MNLFECAWCGAGLREAYYLTRDGQHWQFCDLICLSDWARQEHAKSTRGTSEANPGT